VWDFSDAQLSPDMDDEGLVDREQGVPHLKGVPCRIRKCTEAEVRTLASRYGASSALPRGPRGRVIQRPAPERDFMDDEAIGIGVEFDADELARYGKGAMG
jgi:hypothetical protein